ncbi:MAG TPA: DUF3298/DUF4163 domain-containing protein [Epsilonproteobacteria bacterium]|nr:DUF3298/DUF4163 domain-containing protein [Campylobacterota bacterium]
MRFLLLTAIIFSILNGQENFLNYHDINATQKSITKKACQTLKSKEEFCIKASLTYPTAITSSNSTLQAHIQQEVDILAQKYKPNPSQEEIADMLKDGEEGFWSDWELNATINIFATTPNTFTLKIFDYSYTGGAHGNCATEFKNYTIEDRKVLKLEDILITDYKPELLKIAETHYRELHNIPPNEGLRNFNWFEDEFILASEFAITDKGILWLYNPYEIQPYAFGQSTFLLPYEKIKHLIPSGSVIVNLPPKKPFVTH